MPASLYEQSIPRGYISPDVVQNVPMADQEAQGIEVVRDEVVVPGGYERQLSRKLMHDAL